MDLGKVAFRIRERRSVEYIVDGLYGEKDALEKDDIDDRED
jgi:hypothetical protein